MYTNGFARMNDYLYKLARLETWSEAIERGGSMNLKFALH